VIWRAIHSAVGLAVTLIQGVSAINPYNHETIQLFETNGRDHEQIHGGNVRSVVSQKGPRSLTWRSTSLDRRCGSTGGRLRSPA
jgi:hypothetical protein